MLFFNLQKIFVIINIIYSGLIIGQVPCISLQYYLI